MTNMTKTDSYWKGGPVVVLHHDWVWTLGKRIDGPVRSGLPEHLERVPKKKARVLLRGWKADGTLVEPEKGQWAVHIVQDGGSDDLLCVLRNHRGNMRWMLLTRLCEVLRFYDDTGAVSVPCPNCGSDNLYSESSVIDDGSDHGLYVCPKCSSVSTWQGSQVRHADGSPVLLEKAA